MKQQSFSILLILLMSIVSTKAMAYDITVENADGVTIYYNYINGGEELEVTYEGVSDYYVGNVVIPKNVTCIDKTREVTRIGVYAFGGCSDLTSVTIPNSVTSIGERAFRYCSGLTSVTIGNSVTTIGWGAFQYCPGLTSLIIPNSVTSIKNYAFHGCSGLTSLTIGNSVTSIGNDAFDGCSGLTSVTIPNSVTSIGIKAFGSCSGLTSFTIGNNVTSIGEGAFYRCFGLTSVTIPNSVTSIGWGAFKECSGLNTLIVEEGNPAYDSRNDCNAVIETATNTLHTGCKNSIIPNSVTSIGVNAFYGCSGLTSITIPNSVTSIGDCAFWGCSALPSVTIPNGVTSIGIKAFFCCYGLTSVTIPNSVTSIGEMAFLYCSGLTTVTIGSGIESIGPQAFADYKKLTNVYCYAINVPITDTDAFKSSSIEDATLYVPAESVDAYKDAEPWKNFGTIKEIKVKLSKTKAVIEKGKTLTLKAKVYPTTEDQTVTWKSSDKKVATVTKAGKVKGVGAGTATITCTSKATGAKATCKVTVGYVKLNYNELTIEKGQIVKLKSKVYPSTVKDQSVTWESSDPTIVKVASTGKIKGLKVGKATITCTSNATGQKATCKVTVVKASSAPSLDGSDEEVTGIEEKATLAEEFDVYDLNGRKVLNKVTSLDGLSAGVYIVNGKKVLRQ